MIDEHRYFKRQISKISKLEPLEVTVLQKTPLWDNCVGYKSGNKYILSFSFQGKAVKRVTYTMEQYTSVIAPLKNTWILNKIINRTELAVRIWGDEAEPNSLRRRLEQKAERGTLTREEMEKIAKEVEDLLGQIRRF